MYYEYFGLREAPFKFLPSSTLFLSAAHLEGLAALEWAFNEPSGLTLLVGEVGTGKTMLIHSLTARIKDPHVRIAQISNPTLGFEEMLNVILQQLGIHPVGKGKLAYLQALKTFVADPDSMDRVILIFDEAQGLSDDILEEVRLLSNSRPPQRHALQIILVGQSELVHRLTDPKLRALNQRIGARALLRPLRGEEISDYVNCLLRAQGARHELFSRSALQQVERLSGGLPRKINNLCHNALIQAYLEQSPVVEAPHVQAASVELENLLDTSTSNRHFQFARRLQRWMLVKGNPVMAGGVAVVALAALALIWIETSPPEIPVTHRIEAQSGSAKQRPAEFSKPELARPDQGRQTKPAAASPLASSPQPAKPLGRTASVAARAPATQIVGRDGLPSVPSGLNAARVDHSAIAVSAGLAPTRNISATSPLPKSTSENRASAGNLTYAQRRRLSYKIRRSESSFQDGRYTNAIYHLKRALILDPENSEMRGLLKRAEAAQSRPNAYAQRTAAANDKPVLAADETQATTEASAPTTTSRTENYTQAARSEASEGDAYMRSGKYDLALRKFLMAAMLDPGDDSLNDQIRRARLARSVMGDSDSNSGGETSSMDASGFR